MTHDTEHNEIMIFPIKRLTFNFKRSIKTKLFLQDGQEALHGHAEQAAQLVSACESENRSFATSLKETQHIWDLCVALWGKLTIDEEEEGGGKQDSHKVTMMRREAFSKWLENVVAEDVQNDVQKAQTTGDHIDQVGEQNIFASFQVLENRTGVNIRVYSGRISYKNNFFSASSGACSSHRKQAKRGLRQSPKGTRSLCRHVGITELGQQLLRWSAYPAAAGQVAGGQS